MKHYEGFSLESIAQELREEGLSESAVQTKIHEFEFILDHSDYQDNPLLKDSYNERLREIKRYIDVIEAKKK